MRVFLYILTILIVPGGFLLCIGHAVGRSRKIHMKEEARINRITKVALASIPERERNPEAWDRAPAYGHGSASDYVPEWAVPKAKPQPRQPVVVPKRRRTD